MTNGSATKRSLLAIASLTSALLFFFPPAWAAALVLGVIALVEIKQSGGMLRGRGLAITGIVLSCIWSAALAVILARGLGEFFRNPSRPAWDASDTTESEPAYEPDVAPGAEEPAEETPTPATKATPTPPPQNVPAAEPATKKTPAQ